MTCILTADQQNLLDLCQSRTPPNLRVLGHFIAKLPSLNFSDPEVHATPLQWAASNGHVDACAMLLAYGADVNHRTPDGFNAAELCAATSIAEHEQDHLKLLDLLLRSGSELPDLKKIPLTHPKFHQAARLWKDEATKNWETWCNGPRKPESLTPSNLMQFCSLNVVESIFDAALRHGHKDALRNLISSPDIPPCHVDRWLNTISGLTNLFTPGTCITQQQQEPSRLSSGRVDKAARA